MVPTESYNLFATLPLVINIYPILESQNPETMLRMKGKLEKKDSKGCRRACSETSRILGNRSGQHLILPPSLFPTLIQRRHTVIAKHSTQFPTHAHQPHKAAFGFCRHIK